MHISLTYQLIGGNMKTGVYVGSFNPVHKGHIKVINHLLINNIVDKVIVIPTKNYWDKNNLIDINDRINMLKIYENNKIIINTNLNELQYTYQVLDELKKEYKDLYLIIGDDNLISFDKWKNVDEILKNKVIVMKRNNINLNQYIEKFTNKDSFIIVNDYVPLDISSTQIRKLITNCETKDLENYLDKKVLDYILKNNLYQ